MTYAPEKLLSYCVKRCVYKKNTLFNLYDLVKVTQKVVNYPFTSFASFEGTSNGKESGAFSRNVIDGLINTNRRMDHGCTRDQL